MFYAGIIGMEKLTPSVPCSNGYLSIPLDQVVPLLGLPAEVERLKADIGQLEREMDGLHNLMSDLMIRYADLKKQIK